MDMASRIQAELSESGPVLNAGPKEARVEHAKLSKVAIRPLWSFIVCWFVLRGTAVDLFDNERCIFMIYKERLLPLLYNESTSKC